MTSLTELERALNSQIAAGDILGAFETYYDENVSMQENSEPPCVGKAANRKREEQFVASVRQVHEIRLLGSAVGDGASYSEWRFDITFTSGQRAAWEQAVARRWKNGKVTNERFYYNKLSPAPAAVARRRRLHGRATVFLKATLRDRDHMHTRCM